MSPYPNHLTTLSARAHRPLHATHIGHLHPHQLHSSTIIMKFLLAALLAPVAALALPTNIDVRSPLPASPLEPRQTCGAQCGSAACYYTTTVANAVNAGCQRYQNNNPVNSYPHTYNNYGS